jgi:hypothetical protein
MTRDYETVALWLAFLATSSLGFFAWAVRRRASRRSAAAD